MNIKREIGVVNPWKLQVASQQSCYRVRKKNLLHSSNDRYFFNMKLDIMLLLRNLAKEILFPVWLTFKFKC